MSILTFLARVHSHLQPLICVRADGGSCDNFLHRAVSWGSCVSRFTNLIRKRFRQKLFSQGRVNIRFLPGFDLASICPYQVPTCQVSVFLLAHGFSGPQKQYGLLNFAHHRPNNVLVMLCSILYATLCAEDFSGMIFLHTVVKSISPLSFTIFILPISGTTFRTAL